MSDAPRVDKIEKGLIGSVGNAGIDSSVASSALTINLKTAALANPSSLDPVLIPFRNSTITIGSVLQRSATSVLTLTIPSTATLGHASSTDEPIFLYALDFSGAVELAVSTVGTFDESKLQSTTILNTGSDARATLYSTTDRSNVPIKLLGRLISNQSTAGTWDANASEIITSNIISGSNVVEARVGDNAGTAVTTSATVIFTTVEFDTHGMYDPSNGKFTTHVKGRYLLETFIKFVVTSWNAGTAIELKAFSGSANPEMGFQTVEVAGSKRVAINGSQLLDLEVGDTVEIKISSSGTSANLETNPARIWASMHKLN